MPAVIFFYAPSATLPLVPLRGPTLLVAQTVAPLLSSPPPPAVGVAHRSSTLATHRPQWRMGRSNKMLRTPPPQSAPERKLITSQVMLSQRRNTLLKLLRCTLPPTPLARPHWLSNGRAAGVETPLRLRTPTLQRRPMLPMPKALLRKFDSKISRSQILPLRAEPPLPLLTSLQTPRHH